MKSKMQGDEKRGGGELLKGMAAGIIGGFVASWVMNQFQAVWQKIVEGESRGHGAQSMQKGSPSHGVAEELKESRMETPYDDATNRLAKYISKETVNYKLNKREKEVFGTALHYAFGVSTGAVYGAAAEFLPAVKSAKGVPFGATVWVVADEFVTPLLGLSKSPNEYPLSVHAYALSSHLVYGVTAEMTRRAVRKML